MLKQLLTYNAALSQTWSVAQVIYCFIQNLPFYYASSTCNTNLNALFHYKSVSMTKRIACIFIV